MPLFRCQILEIVLKSNNDRISSSYLKEYIIKLNKFKEKMFEQSFTRLFALYFFNIDLG